MGMNVRYTIPYDRPSVWRWHTLPGSAERLAPNIIPFQEIQATTNLATGSSRYLLPGGLKWITRHELSGFENGAQFTEVAVRSPFRALTDWRLTRRLTDSENGCTISDSLEVKAPDYNVRAFLAYRQHQLAQDFAARARFLQINDSFAQAESQFTVAITGVHSTIGAALSAQLQSLGISILPLYHGKNWDPEAPSSSLIDAADVLVHLAGNSFAGRFNSSHKQSIYDSRIGPTEKLATLIAQSPRCHSFISASSIGYYGSDLGDTLVDESTPAGEGFMATLAHDWEHAAHKAKPKRVVCVRTGMVFSARSGILPYLRVATTSGLSSKLFNKQAFSPWISIDDLCDIYIHAILSTIRGPINAVAPESINLEEICATINKRRPHNTIIPIPSFSPRLILGAQGLREIINMHAHIRPQALQDSGHIFRYSTLDSALRHEWMGEELMDEKGE